ncbi:MAG: MFS transporter [Candidatus Omnitrophota bacterium]
MKRILFFILCLEGAVLSFNVAASSALVPSIASSFALSQFVTGNIIWLYMIPYGLAALFYGPLVRLFNARKIELICIFLFSMSNLMAGLAGHIRVLFIARFLMGIFGASVIPLGIILISRYARKDARGGHIGVFFASSFVSSLAGLLLSGVIPWRAIFVIPACLGLALWVFMYFYLPDLEAGKQKIRFGYPLLFRSRKAIGLFIYIFSISLVYHGIQQWLGVYFSTQFFLEQFYISILITLTSFSGIFGELWGGRLSDKIGRGKVACLGVVGMIACACLFLGRISPGPLAIVMVFWGLSWTFNHAALATLLTDLPEEFLNEAAGLNSGVRFISGGIGAGLGGFLMQRSFSMAFLCFGSMLLVILFTGRFLLSQK